MPPICGVIARNHPPPTDRSLFRGTAKLFNKAMSFGFEVTGGSFVVDWGDGVHVTYPRATDGTDTITFEGKAKSAKDILFYSDDPVSHVRFAHVSYGVYFKTNSLESIDITKSSTLTSLKNSFAHHYNLRSFAIDDTSNVNDFEGAWAFCYDLESFPKIDISNGKSFYWTWYRCKSLHSFPLLDFSSATSISHAWAGCIGLNEFPLIDTHRVTVADSAWNSCALLTSFPDLNLGGCTRFARTWAYCYELVSFPAINFSLGKQFDECFRNCIKLTSLPYLNTSNGIDFNSMFDGCVSLTCLTNLNTSNAEVGGDGSIATHALFRDCDALVAPDDDEQLLLVERTAWVNNDPCGSADAPDLLDPYLFRATFYMTNYPHPHTYGQAVSFFIDHPVEVNWDATQKDWTLYPAGEVHGVLTANPDELRIPACYIRSRGNVEEFRCLAGEYEHVWLQDAKTLTTFEEMARGLPNILTFLCESSLPLVQNFDRAFKDCIHMTSDRWMFDSKHATSVTETFMGCTSLQSSALQGQDYSECEVFTDTWNGCIDIGKVLYGGGASQSGYFPDLATFKAKEFVRTWKGCVAMVRFPTLDMDNVINLTETWMNCLTLSHWLGNLVTPDCVTYLRTWKNCAVLVGLVTEVDNYHKGVNFEGAWQGCSWMRGVSSHRDEYPEGVNFAHTWDGCHHMIWFHGISTPKGENFGYTFADCITVYNMPHLETEAGQIFSHMFDGCVALECLTNINTLAQTDTAGMFDNCPELSAPNPLVQGDIKTGLNYINASDCPALSQTDIQFVSLGGFMSFLPNADGTVDWGDGIDVPFVKDVNVTGTMTQGQSGSITSRCTSIRFNSNTYKIVRFSKHSPLNQCSNMFNGLSNLQEVHFNGLGYNVWSWAYCFRDCSSLLFIDAIDTSGAGNFDAMFWHCVKLKCLTKIDTTSAHTANLIFGDCPQLVAPNATEQAQIADVVNVGGTGYEYVNPNVCVEPQFSATLTALNSTDVNKLTMDAPFKVSWQDGTWVEYNAFEEASGVSVSPNIFVVCDLPTTIRFLTDTYDRIILQKSPTITTYDSMCKNLAHLTSFSTTDSSAVVNMRQAFYGCSALVSFPLIDTSRVTNFNGAWHGCSNLATFPLLDTRAGIDFSEAWQGLSLLTVFPALNTAKGELFTRAFKRCTNILAFPVLDLSSATDLSYMFSGFFQPTSLAHVYDTSSCENFKAMFESCHITSIPLLDTSSGTDFSYMFIGCAHLTTIPALITTAGLNFEMMFKQSGIVTIPQIDTVHGTKFIGMFSECPALTHTPLLDTRAGLLFTDMFKGSHLLACISSLNTVAQEQTTNMFEDTPALVAPTVAEQTVLMGGDNWINAVPCT